MTDAAMTDAARTDAAGGTAPGGARPSLAVVDAHQHFWDPGRLHYPWLEPVFPELNREYGFADLHPHLDAAGVEATVVVQCGDFAEDNEAMFEIADQHREVAGVVAWLPLDDPARAEEMLDQLMRRDRFAGVRDGIHMRPDPDWVLSPEVAPCLRMLEAAQVPFDLVSVLRRHLEHVPQLCERYPDLTIVIDHLSKPPIGSGSLEPWSKLFERASRFPNVFAKVSGLYAAGDSPESWTVAEVEPVVHYAAELFGPQRLMFGSDWPVCEVAGGYQRVAKSLFEIFDEFAPHERDAMLGRTAASVYGLGLEGATP
jgi:L-fuconolactonase